MAKGKEYGVKENVACRIIFCCSGLLLVIGSLPLILIGTGLGIFSDVLGMNQTWNRTEIGAQQNDSYPVQTLQNDTQEIWDFKKRSQFCLDYASPKSFVKHWANCRGGVGDMDWSRALPSVRRFSEMVALLAGRRIVFIGDSVLKHQMLQLACQIGALFASWDAIKRQARKALRAVQKAEKLRQAKGAPKTNNLFQNSSWLDVYQKIDPTSSLHFWMELPKNITMEFIGGGRAWKRKFKKMAYDLARQVPLTFAELHTRDIVVVSCGVHDNTEWELEHGSMAVARAFKDAFLELQVKWSQLPSPARPLVVWQEATPQHFNTFNGLFSGRHNLGAFSRCSPLRNFSMADVRNNMMKPVLEKSRCSHGHGLEYAGTNA